MLFVAKYTLRKAHRFEMDINAFNKEREELIAKYLAHKQ